MTDKDEDQVLAYLQNQSLLETQDYLRRGRRFHQTTSSELGDLWVLSFSKWVVERKPDLQQDWQDVAAEYRLRGSEPPFDRVRQSFDELIRQASDHADRLFRDPERLSEAERQLQEELDEFQAEINSGPRN